MHFDILTLFPGLFTGVFQESIIKRAREAGLVTIDLHNIREYAAGRHKVTDDTPYGGGSGIYHCICADHRIAAPRFP